MLAGQRAAPLQDLPEEIVERRLGLGFHAWLVLVDHQVDVDVAIARVAEGGDLQAVLLLQLGRELEQILEPSARHHDVFVELGQAGVAQGIGELAAQLPELLAGDMADGAIHEAGFRGANDFLQLRDFQPHGFVVSIQLDDEERLAAFELLAAGALAGGGERERIGQFQRAREEAGGKNLADGTGRGAGGIESTRQTRARRRQGQQLEGGLGDDAEHSLGADEHPVQIEAGLVLVRASAEPHERAVRQCDFKAEHVVAGDAVFEAARAAGIGGDVSAEAALRAARGVGRIK